MPKIVHFIFLIYVLKCRQKTLLNKNMKNVQEAVTMQKTADEVTVKQVRIKDDFWSEIQNRIINVLITL